MAVKYGYTKYEIWNQFENLRKKILEEEKARQTLYNVAKNFSHDLSSDVEELKSAANDFGEAKSATAVQQSLYEYMVRFSDPR